VIPSKAIFVISVLISGLIFSPSYSFAQSNQDDNPLSSLFEFFRQLFSFEDEKSEPVIEFRDATIVQTSGISSTTDTTDNNILPTANAGPDQTVLEFASVTLDGSSSTDVDGTIVSFKWTQVSGTSVFLSSMTDPSPMFDAPNVDKQDILTFMLAVVDNSSGTASDKVKITVNEKDDDSGDKVPSDDGSNDPEQEEDNDNDGERKVIICHVPPGNPDNSHTIRVGVPAVVTHLAHGDSIGACPENHSNEDNEKSNDNSGKENKDKDDDNKKQSNSGKGNKDKDDNEKKSNSEKGNKNKDDDHENNKNNSGKGNSGVDNSGKDNKNNKKDDNEKKGNPKLKNNNDDEAKVEDNEHEDEHDDEEDEDH